MELRNTRPRAHSGSSSYKPAQNGQMLAIVNIIRIFIEISNKSVPNRPTEYMSV